MSKQDIKIKDDILKSIKIRVTSIQKVYKLFRNNPFNKDYVHRLRVELRKLRALLNFLKPILNSSVYRKLNGVLRDLGKKLSPIRDLDTLIEICSEIAFAEPQLVDNYSELFSYLEHQRYILADKATNPHFISEFDKYLADEQNILSSLELTSDNDESLEKFIRKRYKQKAKKLKKNYKFLDLKDYDRVHEVRKEAKKVRYAAVGFKQNIPKKDRKPIKKEAKYIQVHLGNVTDIHVSIHLLEKSFETAPSDSLKKTIQKLLDFQMEVAKNKV